MTRVAFSDGIRRGSTLLGAVLSATTLAVGAAVWTVPALTPVGTAAAVVVSAMTLSLPVVAAVLFYSLRGNGLDVGRRPQRLLLGSLLGSLAFFTTGTVAVVSGIESIRTAGDWLYAVGTVVLFVASTATLLFEAG